MPSFLLEFDITIFSEGRKLFIGMLPKAYSGEDVRQMFDKFGDIEEVNVLHDTAGISRGNKQTAIVFLLLIALHSTSCYINKAVPLSSIRHDPSAKLRFKR